MLNYIIERIIPVNFLKQTMITSYYVRELHKIHLKGNILNKNVTKHKTEWKFHNVAGLLLTSAMNDSDGSRLVSFGIQTSNLLLTSSEL